MDGILGELCGLKDRADDEVSRNKCHNGDRPKDSDPIQEGDIHASQVLQIGDGNDIHRTAGGSDHTTDHGSGGQGDEHAAAGALALVLIFIDAEEIQHQRDERRAGGDIGNDGRKQAAAQHDGQQNSIDISARFGDDAAHQAAGKGHSGHGTGQAKACQHKEGTLVLEASQRSRRRFHTAADIHKRNDQHAQYADGQTAGEHTDDGSQQQAQRIAARRSQGLRGGDKEHCHEDQDKKR